MLKPVVSICPFSWCQWIHIPETLHIIPIFPLYDYYTLELNYNTLIVRLYNICIFISKNILNTLNLVKVLINIFLSS